MVQRLCGNFSQVVSECVMLFLLLLRFHHLSSGFFFLPMRWSLCIKIIYFIHSFVRNESDLVSMTTYVNIWNLNFFLFFSELRVISDGIELFYLLTASIPWSFISCSFMTVECRSMPVDCRSMAVEWPQLHDCLIAKVPWLLNRCSCIIEETNFANYPEVI